MAEDKKSLEDLGEALAAKSDNAAAPAAEASKEAQAESPAESPAEATPVADPVELPDPKIDEQGRAYATGRRKDAVARVWIKPGNGKITVNGREFDTYFARPALRMVIAQPSEAADRKDSYDVVCTVSGGGLSGQAGALRHGISRALINFEPALRPVLKKGGFLTRDAREVERKKYGRAKARRSFQFSKR